VAEWIRCGLRQGDNKQSDVLIISASPYIIST
jgi:hypothetical protein